MHIKVGQSTNAYMIADPLAVLEEDEIHLGFSSVFHDPESGFDQSMLHDMDVLVARSPAHLPSDIQKVISVFIIIYFFGGRLKLEERPSDKTAGPRCFQARADDVQRCDRLPFKRLSLFGK